MNKLTVYAVIAILTFGVFSAINLGEFLDYGDGRLIQHNPRVASGLDPGSVAEAFAVIPGEAWQPLASLSLEAQVDAHGLRRPGPFLLANLALHIAATLLLLHALSRLTGRFWPSAFVAAVFAIHPVQVEIIAWASARADALSGLFMAGSLALWAHYVDRPSLARYVAVASSVTLGVLAGGRFAALPFLLLALDVWPLGRLELFGRRVGRLADRAAPGGVQLLGEKAPLLAIAWLGTWVARVSESGASNSWAVDPGLGERLALVCVNLVEAFGRIVWPVDLTFTVPTRMQMGLGPVPVWQVAAASIVLGGVTFGLARLASRGDRGRAVLIGWMWFLVFAIPVAGLLPSGLRMLNDRHLQFAVVGVALAIGFGAAELLARVQRREIVASIAAGLVLVPCAALSRVQVGVWQSSDRLFDHALAVNDRDAMALYYKAVRLGAGGFTSAARANLERAVEIYPDHVHAGLALGRLELSAGRPEDALLAFERLRVATPDSVVARVQIAEALRELDRSDEAMAVLDEAIEIDPASSAAWLERARLHLRLGEAQAAVIDYGRVLELEPEDARARNEFEQLQRLLSEASGS